jgi:hypothetical protein
MAQQIPQWRAGNGQTVGIDLTTGDLDVSAGGSYGGALDVGGALTAGSVASDGAVTGTSVSASGALSGATLTVSGAATLTPVSDRMVLATVAAVGGSGGATAGTLTVTLTRLDGSAVTSARQVYIATGANQYEVGQGASSVTFGSATVGSIVASGNGWALVQTSAAGVFTCVPSNSEDETVYFAVWHALAGAGDVSKACFVLSNSDAASWAA